MKRIISLFLSVIFLICLPITVCAEDSVYTNMNRYNELLSYGLSEKEALQLLQIEVIIDKLENANMKIEEIEGKYQIVDSTNEVVLRSSANVTNKEISYITDLLQNYSSTTHISYDMMLADVALQIEDNPNRTEYCVTYDNGSWIKVKIKQERVDEIIDEKVNTYFLNSTYPNEVEISDADQVVNDLGTYNYTCEIQVFDGIYCAQCFVTQTAKFSNNFQLTEIINVQSGQAAAGIITIANAAKYTNVSSTSADAQPLMWCEVVNQVVFTVSAAAGLSGIFSFSVNAGNSWTQYAIIRTSLIAMHSYGAYYTILSK